ncbi:MAG: nitroreductase family protein [Streptosporangiaceae bacterium]
MDVYEAVTSRRAVRGFTDRHVPREVLERVLSAAAWSPSGSNLQPWHAYLPEGEKGAVLRREGRYASHIVDWRRARDAGHWPGSARPSTTAP